VSCDWRSTIPLRLCVGGRKKGFTGEPERRVIALGANDWVILRRPAGKKVAGDWVAVGVVANELLAKAMEAAAGAFYPGSELRTLTRAAFERELRHEERERILDALRNPTLADKERFALLSTDAEARVRAAHL